MSPNPESHRDEPRIIPPSAEFRSRARLNSLEEYRTIYRESVENPEGFWAGQAEGLAWKRQWDRVLEWDPPYAKWFVGGQINACENCVDRHLPARAGKPAIIFEGEPGDTRVLTYADLHAEVCRFSNVLRGNGIAKGDRVIICLPMVPEAAIAMLACARIGAVHSVVFAGFSAGPIHDRIVDGGATAVITADGGWRRGRVVPIKSNVDAALEQGGTRVRRVIVLRRGGNAVSMAPGRDVWWHEEMARAALDAPPEV